MASAAMILGLAVWMYARTRREVREAEEHEQRHQEEMVPATKEHVLHDIAVPAGLLSLDRLRAVAGRAGAANPSVMLDTGHGWLRIEINITESGPRFQIHPCRPSGEAVAMPKHTRMTLETARLDGSIQLFQFEAAAKFWVSTAVVPEPHEFVATLSMGHEDHAHTYRLRFAKPQPIAGRIEHPTAAAEVIKDENDVYQDAHERAHSEDIARRFAGRTVTTPQIVLFGITGGLMPCPAAFTVLLVCLQIKKAVLGFALVAAFSLGLALTMVVVGVIAAWGVNHAHRRITGFSEWMRRAPYVSCVLLVLLAAFMAWQGWQGLAHPHSHTH